MDRPAYIITLRMTDGEIPLAKLLLVDGREYMSNMLDMSISQLTRRQSSGYRRDLRRSPRYQRARSPAVAVAKIADHLSQPDKPSDCELA
jgi:hypothetical protein